jgi:putative ABC transport system ATP-binding protein
MLQIKNLNHSFKDKEIFKDFSLSISAGQNSLLKGRSGSGKTTLLNIISGLLNPISGEVIFEGQNLCALNEDSLDKFRRENIGIIFQNFYLIHSLTVQENIMLAQSIKSKKTNKNEVLEILKLLNIDELKDKYPKNISFGQMQRVAIARALINQPKILLADEPTSNLDSENANKVCEMLFALSEKYNCTLIVSSHDDRILNKFNNVVSL